MKHIYISFISHLILIAPAYLFAMPNDPFYPQASIQQEIYTSPLPQESIENPTSQTSRLYTLKLHHANASKLVEKLSQLFPSQTLSADERTNQIILQSNQKDFSQLKKIVQDLDKALPQIIIEARIVTMNDASLKEMGVRWGLFDKTTTSHIVNGTLAGAFPAVTANHLNVNLPTINPAGSLTLQLATINGRLLDLELSALEKENSVNIIATPKLMTTNKRKAKIEQGTELPYVVNGKDDTQDVHFKDALLSLEATPQLAQNNKILLDLKITQNTAGEKTKLGKNEFVAIEKQEIDTQVLANNGETIVLGGIFHDTITHYAQKIPILGDLPFIKHLFRKNGEYRQKRELIIFVTPRIIENDTLYEQKKAENVSSSSTFTPQFSLS